MITLSTPGLFSRYVMTIPTAALPVLSYEWAPINRRCGLGDVFVFTHLMVCNRSDHTLSGAQVTCSGNQLSSREDIANDPLYLYFGADVTTVNPWKPQIWPQTFSLDWATWGGTSGSVTLVVYGNWLPQEIFSLA